MKKSASTRTFVLLIVVYSILAGVSVFMQMGAATGVTPAPPPPMSLPMLALVNAGLVFVLYGGLGLLGLFCARKIGLPEIWEPSVTNRQRFLIPALIGAAGGIIVILLDVLFSPINGIGHLPHPGFPLSVIAAITAAIGEETLFRLFFISFWTWLVSKVILRGRWETPIYWVVSVISAIAFAMSHVPTVMYLEGWKTMSQVPQLLMVELLLLNGIIGLAAAWAFKRYGFLAPVGVHLWTDVVWHVLWGLL
jgi:hypothetical protein